jgi:hypothetical protein
MPSRRAGAIVRLIWPAVLWAAWSLWSLSLFAWSGYSSATWVVGVADGRLRVVRTARYAAPLVVNDPGVPTSWGLRWMPIEARTVMEKSGAALPSYESGRTVDIPLWIMIAVLVLATGPVWMLTRPFPLGHCPACGYDLTGNVSGVCPECGRPRSQSITRSPKAPLRSVKRIACTYAVLAGVTAPVALWVFFRVFVWAPNNVLQSVGACAMGHLVLAPVLFPISACAARHSKLAAARPSA